MLRNINKKNNVGTVNIYLDFNYGNQRRQIFLRTSVKLEKHYWMLSNQRVSKGHPNYKELNDLLSLEMNEIVEAINELKRSGINITPESIQEIRKKKNEGIKDFIYLAKEYIDLRVDASPKNLEKLRNLVTRLQYFTKGKKIYLENIDQKFINQFIHHLKTDHTEAENKRLRKAQQPSTIHKTFGFLKQILNYYHKTGLIDDSFKKLVYPSSFKQKQMVLNEEEIRILIAYKPKTQRLQKIKDLALFQLFTGLRYSDLIKINKTMIYNGSVNIHTQKTDQILSIPIHINLEFLLKKYNYTLESLIITNQKYNDNLKVLLKEAEIESKCQYIIFDEGKKTTIEKFKHEMVSSHTFRRSFITNSILNDIPLPVIQSITGHTTLKQLSDYVNIADSIKKQQMSKLDDLFKLEK